MIQITIVILGYPYFMFLHLLLFVVLIKRCANVLGCLARYKMHFKQPANCFFVIFKSGHQCLPNCISGQLLRTWAVARWRK
jgi:hypothetical protein